VGLKNKSELK